MPPEFFGQNICGACEGDGADLDLSRPIVRPLPACRFCGGSGLSTPSPFSDPSSTEDSAARAAAWEREEPEELRRAADEWNRLGYTEYADFLRAWADGRRDMKRVAGPW